MEGIVIAGIILASGLTLLFIFCLIITLTKSPKDGWNWILSVGAMAILIWGLTIPGIVKCNKA